MRGERHKKQLSRIRKVLSRIGICFKKEAENPFCLS
jgi:hypothetical protein